LERRVSLRSLLNKLLLTHRENALFWWLSCKNSLGNSDLSHDWRRVGCRSAASGCGGSTPSLPTDLFIRESTSEDLRARGGDQRDHAFINVVAAATPAEVCAPEMVSGERDFLGFPDVLECTSEKCGRSLQNLHRGFDSRRRLSAMANENARSTLSVSRVVGLMLENTVDYFRRLYELNDLLLSVRPEKSEPTA
jgi:hypothetical protein